MRINVKKWLLPALLLLPLLLTACAGSGIKEGEAAAPSESSAAASPESSAAESPASEFEPVTVEDGTGETLVFDRPVEKVACVVSLCVDVLAELGMEPVAIGESGVRVIAASPEFFGSKGETFPSIGGSFFEPSLEDLVTMEPDLVIGLKGVHEPLREGLKDVAPLFLSSPRHYNDSIAFLETIGRVTGKTAEAETAKQRFLDKLADAKAKAPRTRRR
ncbi:ABC transporter substrate-binding protein [Cohnella algarum]|uniref:ABC transporter substrate-binding protein n=1 Tax=Cohnella algarum TaxID=2044859 RepID=UPI001967E270|nr:ABC transporter substrate-binding protein [Cohnella algarum]